MNSLTDERLKELLAACEKPLGEWIKSALEEKDDLRIPYSKHGIIVRYRPSAFGTYGIIKAQDRYEAWLRTKPVSGSYVSIDEAMAAAEADYSQRILSTLDPTLLSLRQKDGEMVEALSARQEEAVLDISDMTARAKAMNLGFAKYPVEDIEHLLAALSQRSAE